MCEGGLVLDPLAGDALTRMRILFCEPGYSESRRCLAPLIPGWETLACRKDEVAQHLEGVDVVVPYGATIDENIIRAGSFGLVQQFGVGLETIDIPAATAAGVWVANVPSAGSGNAESVAEHAMFLMLALSRRWSETQRAFFAGMVGEPPGIALRRKTACIVGLGHVGTALAKRLRAFEMEIIGVHTQAPESVALEGVRVYPADQLFAALGQADYVIACVRLTAATRGLFGERAFAAMKHGAFFVNIARGGLVDAPALQAALESGRLGGAGLDVFWEEPANPRHPVFQYNVVVTPHVAGVTDDSYNGIAHVVAQNLYRFAKGEPPHHAANAPVVSRWSPAAAVR